MKPFTPYKSYKMVFGEIFFGGLLVFLVFFVPHAAHAQCDAVPAGGDYTATTSCAFSGTVDGVDNGNITINSGVTLTINAGQTIVWGPGKSLIINGSIAINSTGQLRQTRLWLTDADVDNYPATTTQVAADTNPGGQVNRSSVANYASGDCDDNYDTIYPGSASSTVSADGLDQDCDGTVDNVVAGLGTTKICVIDGPGSGPFAGAYPGISMFSGWFNTPCSSFCGDAGGAAICPSSLPTGSLTVQGTQTWSTCDQGTAAGTSPTHDPYCPDGETATCNCAAFQ